MTDDTFIKHAFGLILMDVHVPEMDGFEATSAIRAAEHDLRVPITSMTARALKGDEQHCLEVGMDAHIAKPLRAEALFETISRFGLPD